MEINITEDKFYNLLTYLYKQTMCLQYQDVVKQVRKPRFKEILLRCGFTKEEACMLSLEMWSRVWRNESWNGEE